MSNKTAIYAGSFDPITNGHIDVITRAIKLFDRVIIAIIENPDKVPLFSISERIALIKTQFSGQKNIQVEGFKGLLVDYAKEQDTYTLVRGLRAVSDFDYEIQMHHTNLALESKIETIFLMTDPKHAYLSSSIVRQLASLGGNVTDFVPKHVQNALQSKYKKRTK